MNDTTTIAAGDIQFLDNSVPGLTANEYQIDVTHTINEPSYSIESSFGATQKFIVNGPRFALAPDAIQSRFPSPNAEQDFHEKLAFIVFNDQYLPWCISLNGGNSTYPPSWLAVMIFKPDELIYTPPAPPQQPNPTLSTIRPINDIRHPSDPNTVGPDIGLNQYEESLTSLTASAIDVLGTTFQSLAPQLTELSFLAHVRQLNTGGQTIDGLTGNGYYSVVTGNRLPDTAGSKYIAHLISVEGWNAYLPGGTKTFLAGQVARLISLDSWTFTSDPSGPDFKKLVKNLTVTSLYLPFNPPQPWNAPANVQTEIKTRYQDGYAALNYTTRLGERSFAWYRGPFNPTVPSMIQNTLPGYLDDGGGAPLTNPDEALIYDPGHGVFDLTYAIAFEIGKLVTLANKSASLAIWSWKKDGIGLLQILNNILAETEVSLASTKKTKLSARKNVAENTAKPPPDWDKVKNDLRDIQAGHKKFMSYLSGSFGKHFISKRGEKPRSPIQICDPSKLSDHNDPGKAAKYLPGLLSADELDELATSGKDPYVLIIEKLKNKLK